MHIYSIVVTDAETLGSGSAVASVAQGDMES